MPPTPATVVVLPRRGDTGLGSKVEFCNKHVFSGQFEEVLGAHGARVLYSDCCTLEEVVETIGKMNSRKIFVGGFGQGASLACALARTEVGDVDLGCFALNPPCEATGEVRWRHRLCLCAPKKRPSAAGVDAFVVEDGNISRQVEIAARWMTSMLAPLAPSPSEESPKKPRESREKKGVQWRLERREDRQVRAVFVVPTGCEELLRRFPIICCGASFELEPVEAGRVATTFYSPTPDATADAIALRIARRFDDPNADGAQACPVS